MKTSIPPEFAHFAEPSDVAYNLAAAVEHILIKKGFHDIPLLEVARTLDKETRALNKRYTAMETALSYICQVALIHGACEEEMRRAGDLVEEGDKP